MVGPYFQTYMDSSLVLSALVIGLSFNNTFLCTIMAFSSSVGRGIRFGVGFIFGRLIGIMGLGLAFVLFGMYIDIDLGIVLAISGVSCILFGIITLLFPGFAKKLKIVRDCEIGGCKNCDAHQLEENQVSKVGHDCFSCAIAGSCSGKAGLDKKYLATEKEKWRPLSRMEGTLGFFGVTLLGFLRGASPCLKVLLIIPLLLGLPLLDSISLSAIYALSSSIYPVIGIAIASVVDALAFERFRPYLVRIGAVSLVIIGSYFIYKAWTTDCFYGF